MPVIAIVVHKDNVLLATGGKWLIDGKSKPIQERIRKEQRSTKPTETEAADEIRARLPNGVHMKPLVKKPTYFTTKFIKLSDPNTPGFIKGTFPDPDHEHETPKAAIVREVEEETFTKLDEGKFQEVASHVFKVELTDAESKEVIRNWKDKFTREKTGELVNVEWVPIVSVLGGTRKLNAESQAAVKYLIPPPPGGGTRGSLEDTQMSVIPLEALKVGDRVVATQQSGRPGSTTFTGSIAEINREPPYRFRGKQIEEVTVWLDRKGGTVRDIGLNFTIGAPPQWVFTEDPAVVTKRNARSLAEVSAFVKAKGELLPHDVVGKIADYTGLKETAKTKAGRRSHRTRRRMLKKPKPLKK